MDVFVVNRALALLVMLVTTAGPTLAGEPTPAPRTQRGNASAPALAKKTSTVKAPESSRRTVSQSKLIGAGVRPTANVSEGNSVRKASAVSRSQVVRANSQVMDEGIVYESSGEGYVIDEGDMGGGAPCSSCGDGGCDGLSCGASCGPSCAPRCSSGWGGCGIDLCNPGGGPGRQLCICLPSHGWAQMDYLMWWQDGMHIPPLLTSSPSSPLTARSDAGVLGLNTTSILLGNEDILTERMNGGRIRFGWWFANCPNMGIELEYLGIKTLRFEQVDRSGGNPILARPFFNVAPAAGFAREDSELVAYPNVITGSFSTSAFSTLDGAAVRFRRLLCCSSGCALSHVNCGPVPTQSRIDATLGWRFFQLREGLTLGESLESLEDDAEFVIQDDFQTRNQFNGVELGVLWQGRRGYWSLDSLMRVSVGNVRQEVTIFGSTITTENDVSTTRNGGLLAQRTNSGTFLRDTFGVVPELGVTLGYQCTQHWRLTAGYTFIYMSNVVRPGDQIDRDVNPNLLPPEATPFVGAERPRFDFENQFRQSDYWIQGVNLGAEYRW